MNGIKTRCNYFYEIYEDIPKIGQNNKILFQIMKSKKETCLVDDNCRPVGNPFDHRKEFCFKF
jgi:hypothetical protein